MRGLDRALELHPLAVDLEKHPVFLSMDGRAQLSVEHGHLRKDVRDPVVHEVASCSSGTVASSRLISLLTTP